MQPRFYVQGEEFIQDQFDEVFEVVFIMKGACAIGYRLFEEIFYGQTMILKKFTANKKNKTPAKQFTIINDYSCIFNKCAEFLYTPIKRVEALSIDKHKFVEVLTTDLIAIKIKQQIEINYKTKIQ